MANKLVTVDFPKGLSPEQKLEWFKSVIASDMNDFNHYHSSDEHFLRDLPRWRKAVFKSYGNSALGNGVVHMSTEEFERLYMVPTIDLKDIYG